MKKLNVTIIMVFFCFAVLAQTNQIIAPGAQVEKVKGDFAFTEGPAVAKDGKVFFTDQPNDRIYVWDENQGISLWLEGTNRSNGLYFNKKSQLVACADLNNELVYFDRDKKMHVIHAGFNGKLLNAPNDVWITPKGEFYFSDPYYHRDWWAKDRGEEQEVRGVYFVNKNGEIKRVIADYKQPNGLIGTPDGEILYVSDINDGKIWKYSIQKDGGLSDKTFFAPKGSDGMTIDNRGNVYITSGKVWIYSPAGELIQEIEVPENPANVCFGGKNRDVLFITARTSVYTLKMNVKGVD